MATKNNAYTYCTGNNEGAPLIPAEIVAEKTINIVVQNTSRFYGNF